jgi:hypothetical protein
MQMSFICKTYILYLYIFIFKILSDKNENQKKKKKNNSLQEKKTSSSKVQLEFHSFQQHQGKVGKKKKTLGNPKGQEKGLKGSTYAAEM